MQQLTIVLTHRCNLRCRYCPTLRNHSTISYSTAIIAVDLFLNEQGRKYLIKFSGGEPLIKFALLKNIIIFARNKAGRLSKNIQFQITTNGILLSDTIIDFFNRSKDIELMISLDGDRNTQLHNRIAVNKKLNSFDNIALKKNKILLLPRVTINMVVAPNEAKRFYYSFLYVLKLGFRCFNFLPAYFIYWDKEKIKKLREEFARITKFIIENKKKVDIYLKNLYYLNLTPLFCNGLVVDCNGDIFTNNLILSRQFVHLRNQLKVGNIRNLSVKHFSFREPVDINYLINRVISRPVLESTQAIDQTLTEFVNSLKNETS